jgi:hypothetical protein
MLRDGGPADRDHLGQLTDRSGPIDEALHDRPTGLVAEGAEGVGRSVTLHLRKCALTEAARQERDGDDLDDLIIRRTIGRGGLAALKRRVATTEKPASSNLVRVPLKSSEEAIFRPR